MTKRNITLAGILLILVIIIGIILSAARPKALGLGGLGLLTASVAPVTYQVGFSLPEKQALAVDSRGVNVLEAQVLNLDAAVLPGASLSLLSV